MQEIDNFYTKKAVCYDCLFPVMVFRVATYLLGMISTRRSFDSCFFEL